MEGDVDGGEGQRVAGPEDREDQPSGHGVYEVDEVVAVDELQVHQEEERRAGRQRVARGRRRRHVEALPQTVEACPNDSFQPHAATSQSPGPYPDDFA